MGDKGRTDQFIGLVQSEEDDVLDFVLTQFMADGL
jgi:hypothetical protein